MNRYIEAEKILPYISSLCGGLPIAVMKITEIYGINIVQCQDCKKSHICGNSTHYLWCFEWGRSTDPFGYCERGESE